MLEFCLGWICAGVLGIFFNLFKYFRYIKTDIKRVKKQIKIKF